MKKVKAKSVEDLIV